MLFNGVISEKEDGYKNVSYKRRNYLKRFNAFFEFYIETFDCMDCYSYSLFCNFFEKQLDFNKIYAILTISKQIGGNKNGCEKFF